MTRVLTLSAAEIGVLDELFRAIRRGAHGRDLVQVAQSGPARDLERKVRDARESCERQRALELHVVKGGRR